MALKMATFVYSPKMKRTTLIGQDKTLSFETQNTPQTLDPMLTGQVPRKVECNSQLGFAIQNRVCLLAINSLLLILPVYQILYFSLRTSHR